VFVCGGFHFVLNQSAAKKSLMLKLVKNETYYQEMPQTCDLNNLVFKNAILEKCLADLFPRKLWLYPVATSMTVMLAELRCQ